ncbi:unnamed protein product, partial [Urochloa humidicola]
PPLAPKLLPSRLVPGGGGDPGGGVRSSRARAAGEWGERSAGPEQGVWEAEMSTPARKRLMRDFKRLQQDPPAGISGAPHDNNIMLWNAVIFGPDDTPWDGGTFKLTLQFTEDYPNKPPTVRFV